MKKKFNSYLKSYKMNFLHTHQTLKWMAITLVKHSCWSWIKCLISFSFLHNKLFTISRSRDDTRQSQIKMTLPMWELWKKQMTVKLKSLQMLRISSSIILELLLFSMSLQIKDLKRTETTNSKKLFKILRYKSFSHSSPKQQINSQKRKRLSSGKKFHNLQCNLCNKWLSKMRMVENIWVLKTETSSYFYKKKKINFIWKQVIQLNKFLCICVNTELGQNLKEFNNLNSSRNSQVLMLS